MSKVVSRTHFFDIARQLARSRVVFPAGGTETPQVRFGSGGGKPLGEDAHNVVLLQRVARRAIATDDVVVQHTLQLPAFIFRHLGEVAAAVQPLLFTGDRQKDDGRGKLVLAENPRALERYSCSTAVIHGTRRRLIPVHPILLPPPLLSPTPLDALS